MAKKVIPLIGEDTVCIDAVKEYKVYILNREGTLFILKKCDEDIAFNQKMLIQKNSRWQWISLLSSKDKKIVLYFPSFEKAIKYGVKNYSVYELENIFDLLELPINY